MKCPSCGSSRNRVVDSRPLADFHSIRRRRLCAKCGVRWVTAEVPIDDGKPQVKLVNRADRQEYRLRAARRLLERALAKLDG